MIENEEAHKRQYDKLATALATAQAAITLPKRNRSVKVKGESKRSGKSFSYDFMYTTLDAMIEAVRKPLTDNGLWFVQTYRDAGSEYPRCDTYLLHASGQYIRGETPIFIESDGPQAFGSAFTYARRYGLAGILGIASEEDDDGNAAEGNEVVVANDNTPAPPPAKSRGSNLLNPKKFEPPKDVRPHRIDFLIGGSEVDWGGTFIAAVKSANDTTGIEAWQVANESPLRTIAENAPKVHERIVAAVEVEKKRRERSAELPDTFFETFLIDLEDRLAGTVTRPQLDTVWEANRAGIDALKALDFDKAAALYESNLRRVTDG